MLYGSQLRLRLSAYKKLQCYILPIKFSFRSLQRPAGGAHASNTLVVYGLKKLSGQAISKPSFGLQPLERNLLLFIRHINYFFMDRGDTYSGRIMLYGSAADSYAPFRVASSGSDIGIWNSWEGVTLPLFELTSNNFPKGLKGAALLPLGQWVFLALSTNTDIKKHTGFRYTLASTSSRVAAFNTRGPSGSNFYNLANNSNIFIGADNNYKNNGSEFWLQSVTLYLNYYPNSVDEMINLAIMETGNIFHYPDRAFHLTLIFYRQTLHCAL